MIPKHTVMAARIALAARPGIGLPFRCFSLGIITHDSDPLNDPFSLEIIQYEMLGTAVVPHGYGSGLPAITHSEARLCDPAAEVPEEELAFGYAQLDYAASEVFIDEENFPSCFRVNTHNGVYVHGLGTIVRFGVVQSR